MAAGSPPQILSDPQQQDSPMFFPPLWMQRRAFVLDCLRKERVRSAVELGCGEGNILRVLCQPAFHADEFPPSVIPPPQSWESPREQEARDKLRLLQPCPLNQQELHLRKLAGLDICCDLLKTAQKATAQPAPLHNHQHEDEDEPEGDGLDMFADLADEGHLRWEPLRVDLWEGSLSVYNDSFEGYEAFIATEVIEHLDEETLGQFGNTILAKYNPRLVVITTPNYDFNKYFPTNGDEDEAKHRIADPTKRTDRLFRDTDHKFEWTQDEFENWIRELADEHEYDYQFSGVGNLKHYRKVDQPPDALYATQCAVLRRRDSGQPELRQSRSPLTTPLPFFSSLPDGGVGETAQPLSPTRLPHVLRATQQHLPTAGAGNPASHKSIRSALAEVMNYMRADKVSLRQLWIRELVSKRCGGYVMKLLEAVIDDKSGAWSFDVVDTDRYLGLDNVVVAWSGYSAEAANNAFMGPFQDLSMEDTQSSSSSGTASGAASEFEAILPSALPELFPDLTQHRPVRAEEVENPWAEPDRHLHAATALAADGQAGAAALNGWSSEHNGW